MESETTKQQEFCSVLDDMTQSISSVREVVKSLREKQLNTSDLDTKEGISLLSLKHHILLSYLQSLLLVSSRRALGHSLIEHSAPPQSFGSADREARGAGAGDLVDSMVEGRVVLEKIKALEGKMRYQIEKLVRLAEEAPSTNQTAIDDPLAFRPNPNNLMTNDDGGSDHEQDNHRSGTRGGDDYHDRGDGIYHPPRLAPVPYTETRKDKKARRQPVPSALSSLLHTDPSRPHIESTSGLGSMPSLASARARDLQRITEFEEENFTRVMMKKKDAKRRLRDEEDIALGGSASGGGGTGKTRRRGGLEDEFGDVLKSVGRTRAGAIGDGYEELRKKGRRGDVLERSRMRNGPGTRTREDAFGDRDAGDEEGRHKKKSRFELETKAVKKKLKSRK